MISLNKGPIDIIALILVVIGALNWGLVGLFKFDLVATLLGSIPVVQNIVYILVGLSGVWMAVKFASFAKK